MAKGQFMDLIYIDLSLAVRDKQKQVLVQYYFFWLVSRLLFCCFVSVLLNVHISF